MMKATRNWRRLSAYFGTVIAAMMMTYSFPAEAISSATAVSGMSVSDAVRLAGQLMASPDGADAENGMNTGALVRARFIEARQILKIALRSNPDASLGWAWLGYTYATGPHDLQHPAVAIECYREALNGAMPDRPALLFSINTLLQQMATDSDPDVQERFRRAGV